MDYIREAINNLRDYNDLKQSLDNLRDEVMEIDAELKCIKEVDYSGMPHGSGSKNPDDNLVNKIYRKQKAMQEYKLTKHKLERLDRVLNKLSEGKGNEFQEEIVRYFFVDYKNASQIKKLLNEAGHDLSERQIYRIRDRGIRKLAVRFFGIKGAGD